MRRKTFQVRILWSLIIVLIVALCSVLISASPVTAISLSDYFSYTYTVEFSKTEITGSEVFYSTITVEATCIKDLPVAASEASITGRVIAEHQVSGAEVTLNSSYTIAINPLPNEAGETAESSVVIPLQFPTGSQSGTYNLSGELSEATVKAIIWIPVTSSLPSSQAMGSITYTSISSVVGGFGGGGSAGVTSVLDSITEKGRFTEDLVATSGDRKVELTIYKDTLGKNRMGAVLYIIRIVEKEEPPAPPEDSSIIGQVYDLGPNGATFQPPITVTFTYDPAAIPEGVTEEDLVIAYWDAGGVKWVALEGITVDTVAHTVSGQVSHFTAFSVIAYPRPAALTTSDLTISPTEVNTGESVSISATVTNTGNLAGSYKVSLRIDNVAVATREVTVEGGASKKVTFTVAEDVVGTYMVTIDGLSGEFVVRGPATFTASKLSITPTEVKTGESVSISATITNTGDLAGSYKVSLRIANKTVATREVTLESSASEKLIFTVAEDVAGTYAVTVDGLSGEFVVREPATFVASELSITPTEVKTGESVSISAIITNTGDLTGSHKVNLRIDNVAVATREITVEGGVSEEVTFTVAEGVAGTHAITVDGLSGEFVVREPATFVTGTPPSPTKPTNWWLLDRIVTAGIALVIAISLVVILRRRRRT